MGTFNVALQIGNTAGDRREWIEALVDTGATYSMIPASLWSSLALQAIRTFPFVLADGRRVDYEMAEAKVQYADMEVTTLVIHGDAGQGALLGSYTLEGLGLAVDPVNQRLIPLVGLLM